MTKKADEEIRKKGGGNENKTNTRKQTKEKNNKNEIKQKQNKKSDKKGEEADSERKKRNDREKIIT